MKVLMTADTVGGVWTYALDLVDALAPHDVQVTLATAGAPLRADQRAQVLRSGVARLCESSYALEWMDEPWADVDRAGRWLLEIAAEVGPDLVHLNGYAHASLPWASPVVVVAHSDVLSWHAAVRGAPAGPEWRHYRERVAAGLAAADLVAAPTRAMLDELRRIYRLRGPAAVIPNGTSRSFARRPKEAFVLTAGRLWDEAKNVEALARVAPRLPWPVLVAGDGAAGPGVRSLGRLSRPQLDSLLARAAIFAEPARYEPFGLAALEAGLAGCALVLGDIPSLREVWGDAALYVPPADDDALEAALRRAIEDDRLRGRLAGLAVRRARCYTPAATGRAYLAAYRELLSHERVAAA